MSNAALESTIPPPPATERPVNVCPCCGAQFSQEAWDALPLLGTTTVPPIGGEPGYALELRNCACTNTRAIQRPL